ncbi:nicotinate phosphoribosyltransferase [Campylobacter jejuni]|uniref:nicotinate phosphoribosyltransferase n=2 Tax=Campylobacter jejuni TaxID=197 RepID=UPI0009AA1E88|nr:nicotinate phosphoribosyltransferase [Campylobacter jejuni]EAB5332058.1 nicotinate phosphoribosyltransferase [Campylobacter jejuni]EAC1886932.1 nicotinate phosphoribosyltransferase [Campylobacter jejuni]EAC2003818.1 nicotinate phosphoribosyltransferase [Campylobacter jejuni]EAH4699086.1 nicotinate phosphoribosyltransferase [Campylobacter jejuni]EAH4753885.1 nicotinate phosphoribosyltransferase [Campylobacter jejuni]
MMTSKTSLTLLCDFYEFTMSQGYFKNNKKDQICYFDIFFRKIPDSGSFAIFAGLEDILDFVENLSFDAEDIEFLRKQGIFDTEFLDFLANFKFKGEIYAMREGEVIFPNEPLLCIKATTIEAQLLETFLLLSLNHQSLIATKTNRIVRAAKDSKILEFGSRRAQGSEAALKGARAAFIGGCIGSACTLAGKIYNIPINGTMAHSWVQMFENELEAFKAYVKIYPKNPVFLIDTYDCLNSGLKNAIKVFKEFGIQEGGVRIDSGNLLELSLKIRQELDQAGLQKCKIIVSNALDEWSIKKLKEQNAPIDIFGVGERLITASSDPIFSCVYKLAALEDQGIKPKIKISENNEKSTLPHFKKLFRVYDKNTQKILFDELYVFDENPNQDENLERKELLELVYKEKRLLKKSSLNTIQDYTKEQISKLDEGFLDLDRFVKFEVKLSPKLQNITEDLLKTRF